MKPNPSPHSAPASPPDLRLAALRRRVAASGALASILADLAYGIRQRDHGEALYFTTAARVAACGEVRT